MNSAKKIKDFIQKQILLIRELPFAPLSDRSALISGRDQQIPKIVYQTFRENSFGKTHLKEIYRFHNLNPDLAFMFFDEEHRDAWMTENFRGETILDICKRSSFGPSKADIFRYCIIYKLGGYYFDISKGCTTPLTELHAVEAFNSALNSL